LISPAGSSKSTTISRINVRTMRFLSRALEPSFAKIDASRAAGCNTRKISRDKAASTGTPPKTIHCRATSHGTLCLKAANILRDHHLDAFEVFPSDVAFVVVFDKRNPLVPGFTTGTLTCLAVFVSAPMLGSPECVCTGAIGVLKDVEDR